jgi:hypothetical protein
VRTFPLEWLSGATVTAKNSNLVDHGYFQVQLLWKNISLKSLKNLKNQEHFIEALLLHTWIKQLHVTLVIFIHFKGKLNYWASPARATEMWLLKNEARSASSSMAFCINN